MRQKSGQKKELAEKVIRAIRRDPRKQYSAEEKIRIVLAGLRGEDRIAELCRRVSLPCVLIAISGCTGHCHCLDELPTTSSRGHPTMELFEPLDPMFAISLDLPCKRIPAVEPEMRDRDDLHLLGITKAEIEMARDATFVAHVPNFSDATLVWKIALRILS